MISATPDAIVTILIIEDNAQYSKELQRAFRQSERGLTFETNAVASASEAEPFIEADGTDIYIVDLELPEFKAAPNEKVGELLVKKIIQRTDGGVIIHTGILRKDRDDFLWGGVDDYIMKGDPISSVVARAFAVWRRVKEAKNTTNAKSKNERSFRLGKWRFQKGNRNVVSDDGKSIRLSPTELAFVQYLCTVTQKLIAANQCCVHVRPAFEEVKNDHPFIDFERNKVTAFSSVLRHDAAFKFVASKSCHVSKKSRRRFPGRRLLICGGQLHILTGRSAAAGIKTAAIAGGRFL